jgi:hypothetical protein
MIVCLIVHREAEYTTADQNNTVQSPSPGENNFWPQVRKTGECEGEPILLATLRAHIHLLSEQHLRC